MHPVFASAQNNFLGALCLQFKKKRKGKKKKKRRINHQKMNYIISLYNNAQQKEERLNSLYIDVYITMYNRESYIG